MRRSIEDVVRMMHADVKAYHEDKNCPMPYAILSRRYSRDVRALGVGLVELIEGDERLMVKENERGARFVVLTELFDDLRPVELADYIGYINLISARTLRPYKS